VTVRHGEEEKKIVGRSICLISMSEKRGESERGVKGWPYPQHNNVLKIENREAVITLEKRFRKRNWGIDKKAPDSRGKLRGKKGGGGTVATRGGGGNGFWNCGELKKKAFESTSLRAVI